MSLIGECVAYCLLLDHSKLQKILKEMVTPNHLTPLLRNLCAGQEAQLEPDMEQPTGSNWERRHQGCILSPCLFNFYAEYIMRNAGLDGAQAEIKIAGRKINNLRYADDTTLKAESEEELKSLFVLDESERGEWKSWLKTQHSEN